MKSQKRILVFEILLCLSVAVIMGLIVQSVYANAFRIGFIAYLLPNWIGATLVNWRTEANKEYPKFRWFTFLLLAVTIALFLGFKPRITYEEGKDIIASHGYANLYELQDKSITSFRLKKTRLIPEAYLYGGEQDKIKYYILLSPVDGEIQAERIGEGNYLDLYFAMKYGR
ncbi:MAG: hypothetical protein ACOX8W_09810 [bacterium]|jgi:hypothetical protein